MVTKLKTKIRKSHQAPWRWRNGGNAWSLPWQRAAISKIVNETNSVPSYKCIVTTTQCKGQTKGIQYRLEVYALVHYRCLRYLEGMWYRESWPPTIMSSGLQPWLIQSPVSGFNPTCMTGPRSLLLTRSTLGRQSPLRPCPWASPLFNICQ